MVQQRGSLKMKNNVSKFTGFQTIIISRYLTPVVYTYVQS